MEQLLAWAAGLTLAGLFVGALVWLSARYDHDDEQEQDAADAAARKVVRCCDGRAVDCPAGHRRPSAARTVRRVPARW